MLGAWQLGCAAAACKAQQPSRMTQHRAGYRQVSFTFSTQTGNTVGVAFECALVPGTQGEAATSFGGCASPAVYQGLADGAWQFFVRAVGEDLADSAAFFLVRARCTCVHFCRAARCSRHLSVCNA